jgi:hypothetical protein
MNKKFPKNNRINTAGLVQVADEAALRRVPLYHCNGKWFGPNQSGGFSAYKDTLAAALLGQFGFKRSVKSEVGNSEAEVATLWLTQNKSVHYAGALAGYPVGMHESCGQKILVTEALPLIKPKPGKCPTVLDFIQRLLDDPEHDQVSVFLSVAAQRYQRALRRLEGKDTDLFQHCPLLAIFGEKHSGKSALLDLILTPLFGGRVGSPLTYLNSIVNGKQPFNKEMIPAILQIIDDKNYTAKLAMRRALADAIKSMIWSPNQRLEGKGVDAVIASPFWWLLIAGNLENEASLNILPTLDGSLHDKIVLLKARKVEGLPVGEAEKKAWKEKLQSELPAFAHFLLNFKLPKQFKKPIHEDCTCGKCVDNRTSVLRFWHPEIAAALLEKQPEQAALEVIDILDLAPWEGTATEFYALIRETDKGGHYERLFYSPKQCGGILTELWKLKPERVMRRASNGANHYTLSRAR